MAMGILLSAGILSAAVSLPSTRGSLPHSSPLTTVQPQAAEAVSEHTARVHEQLLAASELLEDDGHVTLSRDDIETALADMHLQRPLQPMAGHPSEFLPASLYAATSVDATDLVISVFPRVLEAHPIFRFMVIRART